MTEHLSTEKAAPKKRVLKCLCCGTFNAVTPNGFCNHCAKECTSYFKDRPMVTLEDVEQ